MQVLEADQITAESLENLLHAAAIPCEIDDDGDVYVPGGDGIDFPMWLSVKADSRCISLWTCLPCNESVSRGKVDLLAEKLNRGYGLVQFTVTQCDEGRYRLNGQYWLIRKFGVIVPQLIATMQDFSQVFISAVKEQGQDNLFFT